MKPLTPESLLQTFPGLQSRHPCGQKAAIAAAQAALNEACQLASTPGGVLLLAAALLLTKPKGRKARSTRFKAKGGTP